MMNRRRFLAAGVGAAAAMPLAGSHVLADEGRHVLTATDVHVKDYPTVEAVRWIGETMARETGGRVTLRLETAEGGRVRFSVQDTGIGIAKEDQQRLERLMAEPDAFDLDPSTISGPLEALLLMATEPMSAAELAQALDVPKPVVWEALDQLRSYYDETGRGFELREIGTGWRYYTRAEHHEVIARWLLDRGRASVPWTAHQGTCRGRDGVVHLDPDAAEELVGPHVTPTVMRGRELRGWLDLAPEATASDVELAEWVRRTVDHARSLPPP